MTAVSSRAATILISKRLMSWLVVNELRAHAERALGTLDLVVDEDADEGAEEVLAAGAAVIAVGVAQPAPDLGEQRLAHRVDLGDHGDEVRPAPAEPVDSRQRKAPEAGELVDHLADIAVPALRHAAGLLGPEQELFVPEIVDRS